MLEAGTLAPIVDALGGLALLFTAGAVFGRGGLAAAVFSLATEYVLVEVTGRAAATSVIVYAVGLILLCELVVWACDLRSAALVDRHIVLDQLLVLAVAALAAALLAVVALAATTVQLAEAFEAALLGTAAAVALLALPWLLLRNAGAG